MMLQASELADVAQVGNTFQIQQQVLNGFLHCLRCCFRLQRGEVAEAGKKLAAVKCIAFAVLGDFHFRCEQSLN